MLRIVAFFFTLSLKNLQYLKCLWDWYFCIVCTKCWNWTLKTSKRILTYLSTLSNFMQHYALHNMQNCSKWWKATKNTAVEVFCLSASNTLIFVGQVSYKMLLNTGGKCLGKFRDFAWVICVQRSNFKEPSKVFANFIIYLGLFMVELGIQNCKL